MSIPEITPAELVVSIEAGNEVRVLDVRRPHHIDSGRIDIVPDDHYVNMRTTEILGTDDVGLDRETPLAVVCYLGNDSKVVTQHLNERGYNATSVTGGMNSWMRTGIARELPTPPELDRLVQVDRIGKGALGYVLISDGEALIVDPPRVADHYLDVLDEAGATLVGVADTHAHADYISGAPGLAARFGVPYYLHPSDAVYPYDGTPGKITYEKLHSGMKIPVGRAEIEALHTPGHTEGHVSYRLGDRFALTGDFIFVHSVGRPDLGDKTEEWTHVLHTTLADAKAQWPAELEIYPSHYGSPDERRPDKSVAATFGELSRINEPFAIDDAAEFLAWVTARAGSFPEVYRKIKAINIGLTLVDDAEADELEVGKNACALG